MYNFVNLKQNGGKIFIYLFNENFQKKMKEKNVSMTSL